MRGRYNFNLVRYDYFRDRDIAFQAFFAKSYDFREEFTSRNWATQYNNKLPIKDGLIVRETLPDATPSGVQAFFFNMRRNKFKDRRVRSALDLAFDFRGLRCILFLECWGTHEPNPEGGQQNERARNPKTVLTNNGELSFQLIHGSSLRN